MSDAAPSRGTPRTFASAREAAVDIVGVWLQLPALVRVYLGGTLDPTIRERVMVAVSRVNACAGCTTVHERWALHAGVTAGELDAIGLGDLALLDHRSRAAIVYATALAHGRFRVAPDPELLSSVRRHLSSTELRGIEAVARMIAVANLSANGLHDRRRRKARAVTDVGPVE